MSKFKKAIKKKKLESAFSSHPLKELEEDVKNDYIKGLVFIAVEDENFSEDEKSYVTSLMSYIGVDETLLNKFETFANEPDEDELLEFMDRIKAFDEELKISFLIETILVAFKDGDFDDAEKEMFNEYVEMLELEEKKDDIMHIATALANKDIDLALAIYTAKKEFFEKYNYMFEMIDVDIEKELKEVYSWDWIKFRLKYGEVENNNLVASKPVTNRQFCIYLNSSLLSNKLKRFADTTQFEVENEVVIADIDDTDLKFENGLFSYDEEGKDSCMTGVKKTKYFSDFVNQKTSNNVQLLEIELGTEMRLSESAKRLLVEDKTEKFMANISANSIGEIEKFFDTDERYYYDRSTVEKDGNYIFRLMQTSIQEVTEEEQ